MAHACLECGGEFDPIRASQRFCSRQCSDSAKRGVPFTAKHRAAISRATRGKPKPWVMGELNPNYGNKAAGTPKARAKFIKAVKKRGQAWTARHRKEHARTMSGPANKMRGNTHTEETRRKLRERVISKATRKRISRAAKGRIISPATRKKISLAGIGRKTTAETKAKQSAARKLWLIKKGSSIGRHHISKPEKEVRRILRKLGVKFKSQFRISGLPYRYDFFLPDRNLIVEFNGDYWHFNPSKYASGSIITRYGEGKVLVNDIWERDRKKLKAAEDCGYQVAVIWEADYKLGGVEAVRKAIGL